MTMPDIAKIAAALDAEIDRRNEHYGLDNWSSEEVVRWVLDHAEAGGWKLLPPLGVHKIGELRPQPILPSPMMGELGHGRPSLFRWIRRRNGERKARDMLAEVYTPEGVEAWLNGRKRSLGGQRPIDLIRAGESDRVLARIAQLRDGVMG